VNIPLGFPFIRRGLNAAEIYQSKYLAKDVTEGSLKVRIWELSPTAGAVNSEAKNIDYLNSISKGLLESVDAREKTVGNGGIYTVSIAVPQNALGIIEILASTSFPTLGEQRGTVSVQGNDEDDNSSEDKFGWRATDHAPRLLITNFTMSSTDGTGASGLYTKLDTGGVVINWPYIDVVNYGDKKYSMCLDVLTQSARPAKPTSATIGFDYNHRYFNNKVNFYYSKSINDAKVTIKEVVKNNTDDKRIPTACYVVDFHYTMKVNVADGSKFRTFSLT
jgi:hypothetical protein